MPGPTPRLEQVAEEREHPEKEVPDRFAMSGAAADRLAESSGGQVRQASGAPPQNLAARTPSEWEVSCQEWNLRL